MPRVLVNIDVANLEAAIRFYTSALGLRLGRRFGPEAAELLGAEAPIYLLEQPAGSVPFAGAAMHREYRRHWTPVHLDFAVEDLEAAVQRAEAAGAKREGAVSEQAWGRIAYCSDPFGNGFCLLEFNERGYDAIATG
ncbi:MAG: VOC family protein [Pseudomonadota bacterium]